jgi:hypothetical protein
MAPYLPSLHLFLSISGPHLGYVGGEMTVADSSKSRNRFGLGKSAAFQLGLCCTRAINPKAKCLSEITFRDCAKIEDCYLYRLAHHPNGLGLFRHVVLVSSPQDKYVPEAQRPGSAGGVSDQGRIATRAGDDGDGARDAHARAREGDEAGTGRRDRTGGGQGGGGSEAEGTKRRSQRVM